MMAATEMTLVTPMTMPRIVSPDRILRLRSVSSATSRFSLARANVIVLLGHHRRLLSIDWQALRRPAGGPGARFGQRRPERPEHFRRGDFSQKLRSRLHSVVERYGSEAIPRKLHGPGRLRGYP